MQLSKLVTALERENEELRKKVEKLEKNNPSRFQRFKQCIKQRWYEIKRTVSGGIRW